MINNRIYSQIFVLLFILLIQFYVPSIIFSNDLMLFPDLLLIYLVYISVLYDRHYVIFFGFVLGLFQDFVSQSNLLGLFAFGKTIAGFLLGMLYKYDRVWKNMIKIGFLFLTFQIHYIFSCYLMFDRTFTPIVYILKVSTIQSIFMIILFMIVNRFILIDNKIIK